MSKNLAFYIPYHTGYAHAELVNSFASYTDVHLFIYKWNPSHENIKEYFSNNNNNIYFHEFSIDNILLELIKEKSRNIVVILTASTNYLFGQLQLRLFRLMQKYISILIDIYSVGHCMYGCQSCVYSSTHSLPITFTNYIKTRNENNFFDKNFQILICPSYSFENAPTSFLSNNDIIEYILTLNYSHIIKFHPLIYDYNEKNEHPFLSLTNLEKENIKKLYQSNKIFLNQKINILKLIEYAKIIICDSNSSIPFETLYFQDKKYLFVYKPNNNNNNNKSPYDDREKYFHLFSNIEQLKNLIENFFQQQLQCKTDKSHEFFLEKYSEPNGNEIEQLCLIRQWNKINHEENIFNIDTIKQAINNEFKSILTPMALYALGDHTMSEINQFFSNDEDDLFDTMLNNINEL